MLTAKIAICQQSPGLCVVMGGVMIHYLSAILIYVSDCGEKYIVCQESTGLRFMGGEGGGRGTN